MGSSTTMAVALTIGILVITLIIKGWATLSRWHERHRREHSEE